MKTVCKAGAMTLAGLALTAGAIDSSSFRRPPKDAYPEAWFHLIGGNVTHEGLTADLEAIAGAGISGIQLFHGQVGKVSDWPGVTKRIPCLSEHWEGMLVHVGDECARLGLNFKMQNCPGWSMSGGPWVTPETAMRMLTYARLDFETTGGAVSGKFPEGGLPMPENWCSPRDRTYRDICVLAFPSVLDDGEAALEPASVSDPLLAKAIAAPPVRSSTDLFQKPGANVPANASHVAEVSFATPVTIRTVELPAYAVMNLNYACEPDTRVKLEAFVGGKWTTTLDTKLVQSNWQDRREQHLAADEATAEKWRFTFATGGHPMNLRFVHFYSRARLDNWEGRAGWTLRGLSGTPDRRQSPKTWVLAKDVVDCTSGLKGDGSFSWTPPKPGKWTVLRIGHVFNGMKNSPAPAEATGMECDKLSPKGIEAVFAGYLGKLADGPLKGKLKGGLVDSWECRRQNWTPGMEKAFRDFAGYDLRLKLPAVFGWVLDTPEATAKFLLDWRGCIGRLIEDNYYGRMAELCHGRGMTCQYETAFGDVVPGDLMRFWKYADEPMCEFWQPHRDRGFVGSHAFKPVRPCVSAGRLYGKRRISAEACTSFELTWNEDFRILKDTLDKHLGRGVTHCVFQTYTHNPLADGRLPGSSFGAKIGTPFLRGQTWWKHMPELTAYLARTGWMLESGKPVTDVLLYLGDALGHKPDEHALVPDGYLCDYLNQDALLTRLDVKGGRWTTPEGISWSFVWIPEGTYLKPETVKRLKELRKKGGKVFVKAEKGLETILPDVKSSGTGDALVWQHRQDASGDWYFVAAPGEKGHRGTVTFRAKGAVTLWDPATGGILPGEANATKDGRTEVALDLAPGGSVFVVFDRSGCVKADRPAAVSPPATKTFPFRRKWTLRLSCDEKPSELSELKPWRDLPGSAERKAFSGDGVYANAFDRPNLAPGERLELDLDQVGSWAKVFVNGKAVRTLWCEPFACDITDFLKDGENAVRIEVTSTWHNRLAFDAALPEAERKTWTICGPEKGTAPKFSGLGGAVRLLVRGKSPAAAAPKSPAPAKAVGSPFGEQLIVGAPFGSGMVLQRGVAAPVWGWAKPGTKVVVTFAGQMHEATAGADGGWRVRLRPLQASREGRVLTVVSEGKTRKYEDVVVGEVWLAGGQSNMECPIVGDNPRYRDGEGATVIQYTDLPRVRYANLPLAGAIVPEKRAPVRWHPFSPKTLVKLPGEKGAISAVAFYYARELHLALGGVPVGILEACCGGTGIDTWTPRIGLETRPDLKDVLDFPVTEQWDPSMKKGVWYSKGQQPTYFYNAMIAPLAPFAIKGAIWYQGCNNDSEPERYCSKLHALYNGWSKAFENPQMSFHLAQLAPFAPLDFRGVQLAQAQFVREEPHASLAVLSDVGNPADIHPNNKETVARRLLLHALKRDYGFADIRDESPSVRSVRIDGDLLTVELDNAEGLYVYSPDKTMSQGFELAGKDGIWHPAEIQNFVGSKMGSRVEQSGAIGGAEIVLKAKDVPTPVAVRYLAVKPFVGNVYNSAALPLGPFEAK